jgi:hypothetical protein
VAVEQAASMARLKRVISGGQTGVDQAALRAAQACGIEIGGWCPPGRACDGGVIPPEFPLRETPSDRSPKAPHVPRSLRTQWNVRDADATLILHVRDSAPPDAGTDWTARFAAQYGRPLLTCDVAAPDAGELIARWLHAGAVRTLNVAGPSEATAPGIGEAAYALLYEVFWTNG